MKKKKIAKPTGSILRCFNKRPDNTNRMYRMLTPVVDNFKFGKEEDKQAVFSLCTECALHKIAPNNQYTFYFICIDTHDEMVDRNSSYIVSACAYFRGCKKPPFVPLSPYELREENNKNTIENIICYCGIEKTTCKEFIKECSKSKYFCLFYCISPTDQEKEQYRHEVEAINRKACFISIKGVDIDMERILNTSR